MFEDLSFMAIIFFLFLLVLTVLYIGFYIWMFIDIFQNKKLSKSEKGIWILLFIVFSVLAPIIYFIIRK